MIYSYLWYTLFISYHFLFFRISLFLLFVYRYIIIIKIVLLIWHPLLIIKLLFSCVYYFIRSDFFLVRLVCYGTNIYAEYIIIRFQSFVLIPWFIHWISLFEHQNLFVLILLFIHWISLFDHQIIKRLSFISFIHI